MAIKTIITDNDDVVRAIGDESTFRQDPADSRVVYLGGSGYAIANQHVYHGVETEGVSVRLYKYDGQIFTPYLSERERIAQEAIDRYTEELIEGGLL